MTAVAWNPRAMSPVSNRRPPRNIRILDEKLTVSLGPNDADVEVRYLMRNETRQKVKVRFGFPVEESFDRTNTMV